MRLDYTLYTVAIIFFILTGIAYLHTIEYRELLIVATAVLGLFFAGVGYAQRPKTIKTTNIEAPTPTTPATTVQAVQEEMVSQKTVPSKAWELTEVKGIGAKRAEQLKALGITSVEDLAKASAEDLAAKLKISQKIVSKWVEEAKGLIEKQ